jgi:hypothetical protein
MKVLKFVRRVPLADGRTEIVTTQIIFRNGQRIIEHVTVETTP